MSFCQSKENLWWFVILNYWHNFLVLIVNKNTFCDLEFFFTCGSKYFEVNIELPIQVKVLN
jgi:hypothetical protein